MWFILKVFFLRFCSDSAHTTSFVLIELSTGYIKHNLYIGAVQPSCTYTVQLSVRNHQAVYCKLKCLHAAGLYTTTSPVTLCAIHGEIYKLLHLAYTVIPNLWAVDHCWRELQCLISRLSKLAVPLFRNQK